MNGQLSGLKRARQRLGWSQEQAIVRIETLARQMGLDVPARTSLRTLLSLFENQHRAVPVHYRPVFRELYRATDEELGLSGHDDALVPVPPALPKAALDRPAPEILDYLRNVLAEHVRADALLGPRYLVPVVQSQLPLIDRLCTASREPERPAVLSIGAQFAEFCGWLYQDSGVTESAIYWTNHALDYASELGDGQAVSYILMRKSNIVTEAGTPGHGLGLANAALNASANLRPSIRAVSLRSKARAHAILHESSEFERSIDEALASIFRDLDVAS